MYILQNGHHSLSLVNIYHLIQLQKFFFPCNKNFQDLLSQHLSSTPYSSVNYIVTMLYITSSGLISFIIGSLYLSTTFNHFTCPPVPASGNHPSVLCFYKFLKNFIEIQLIYNVVLTSAVQQSDSIIHTYIYI